MTREEMADVVHIVADAVAAIKAEHYKEHSADLFDDSDAQSLMAAVAEFRKTCATCQHWGGALPRTCPEECFNVEGPNSVPSDGSGHCYLHDP